MKRILDQLVRQNRARWSFRLTMVLSLFAFFWVYTSIEKMGKDFDTRMQQQAQMWMLEDEVMRLELETTDSILEASRDSAARRMLNGWLAFAQWSERARSLAGKSEMDMDWTVGELIPIPNIDIKASRLPLTMKLVPWSRSFEQTLAYVQKISADPSVAWWLSEVIVEGSSEGVSNSQLSLSGWIRP